MRLKLSILIAVIIAIATLFMVTKTNQESGGDFLIDDKVTASSVVINTTYEEKIPQEGPPAFNIASQSALARELNNEATFYDLNSQQRWPIASLTKLMTAVIALETLPSSKEVDNLIKAMILISNNEAAEQLAAQRNRDNFIVAMNKKAVDLSMKETSFFDASGLSFLNQSTVNDLYKLVDYIVSRHPQIFQWSREKELMINGLKYTNINKFVGRKDFFGGKTGYTDEASGNLISIFSVSKKIIVIIVLGAPDQNERFEQTENLLEWISQYYKL